MANTISDRGVLLGQPNNHNTTSERNTTSTHQHRPVYVVPASREVLRAAINPAVITSAVPPANSTADARKQPVNPTSKRTREALPRIGLAYCTVVQWFKEHKNLIIQIVALLAFAIGVIGLWPAITAASDSKKARALAEWEAEKDFIEACQSHEWKSCDNIRDVELRPPPNFGRHDWSRRSWRKAPLRKDVHTSTQANQSIWSPMAASTAPFLLLLMVSVCRNRQRLLRMFRQYSQKTTKTGGDDPTGFWANTDRARTHFPRYNVSGQQDVGVPIMKGELVASLASSRDAPSSDRNITIMSELRRRKIIHRHKKERAKPGDWSNKHALLDLESDSDREDFPVGLKSWVPGLKRRATLGAKRRSDQSRLQLLGVVKCSHCGVAYAPDRFDHARFCQKRSK